MATYYVSSSQRKKEATRKHYLPDTATGGKVTCLYYNYTIMPLCRLNNIEAVVRQRRGVALGLGCSWPCQDNSDKHVVRFIIESIVSCCQLKQIIVPGGASCMVTYALRFGKCGDRCS